jgi:hypothetical protein
VGLEPVLRRRDRDHAAELLKAHIYCPDPDSPAFEVAGRRTVAAYDDAAALQARAGRRR